MWCVAHVLCARCAGVVCDAEVLCVLRIGSARRRALVFCICCVAHAHVCELLCVAHALCVVSFAVAVHMWANVILVSGVPGLERRRALHWLLPGHRLSKQVRCALVEC